MERINQIIINKLRNTVILPISKLLLNMYFVVLNSSDHAIHSTWTVKY